VEQILAVGDSYTAGIGSNGWSGRMGDTNCSRYYHAWPNQLLWRHGDDWDQFNDGRTPDLTFGACSGNVMKDLREKQLKQGDPVDTWKNDFTPIGRPQIAVLTISGNDAEFSNIINDCVFRWPWKAVFKVGMLGCDERLNRVETLYKSLISRRRLCQPMLPL
jgi:lysophospholipase L1-like esterase